MSAPCLSRTVANMVTSFTFTEIVGPCCWLRSGAPANDSMTAHRTVATFLRTKDCCVTRLSPRARICVPLILRFVVDMKVPTTRTSAAMGRVAQPPDALLPMVLPLEHSVAAPRKFHFLDASEADFGVRCAEAPSNGRGKGRLKRREPAAAP